MPQYQTLRQRKMGGKSLFLDGGRAAHKEMRSHVLLDDHKEASSEVRALQLKQQILRLEQKNRRLVDELESKESLLGLLQDHLSEGLDCPKCNQPFGSAQVPYILVGCGHTICIGCILSVLEVEDGGSPHPYECPICLEAIDAPPRRDVKSEQLVCWLQLAQGNPIDTPEDIPLEIFDEYFANSGYISEEV